VVRKTDKTWAGLSTDLVIETEYMRSIKTIGGFSYGRGFTDSQRAQWVLSRPAFARVNRAMQALTGTPFVTSEQHKDMSKASEKRDSADSTTMVEYLKERNPFAEDRDQELRSISTGVVAGDDVNVTQARSIGENTLASMEGKEKFSYSFRKKTTATTMETSKIASCDDPQKLVTVDPQLLFQRLATVASRDTDDYENSFQFELSTYPTSLFEGVYLPRSGSKSTLADTMWTMFGSEVEVSLHQQSVFVLDGGSLLYRVPWMKGMTYAEIFHSIVEHVQKRYGDNCTVVFDGYNSGPQLKDATHRRRGHIPGRSTIFQSGMKLTAT
jgi:hypothetical protein